MGKFEDAIPENIALLEKQIKAAYYKRANINWGHECECEYCDRNGEEADPDAEAIAEDIEVELKQLRLTIERLKRHKTLFDSRSINDSMASKEEKDAE
jgi:hypothetical protein